MPIYEFKCPEGHVFEVFQRMSDQPPEACSICGKSPLEKVLYPVAVHFKGSGFYSTDYGPGSRKRETAKDADPTSGKSEDATSGKSEEAGKKDEKKPAET